MPELPNKVYFSISLILLVLGAIFSIVFAIMNLVVASLVALLFIPISVYMLLDWNTRNYIWRCEKCNHKMEISNWQNFWAVNGGTNRKKLYCPNCKTKKWFKGIKKSKTIKLAG